MASTITIHPRSSTDRSQHSSQSAWGRWLFILPLLILNLIVVVVPSIFGLLLAFTDWSGYGRIDFIRSQKFYRIV
jgi:ABC-type sugar transport system permease subunit